MSTQPTGEKPKPSVGTSVLMVVVMVIAGIIGFIAAQAAVRSCRGESGTYGDRPGPVEEKPAKDQGNMLK